jgi:hypothetical protein
MKHRKNNNTVARLSCAALALPGLMQTATAGRVDETYNADFQYGHYEESNSRMRVDVTDLALSAPIGKNMTGNVGILRDTIAGASPVYNSKDANGRIAQVISGATPKGVRPSSWCGESVCEQRDAVNAGLTYFFDAAALNFGGGFSQEQDYTSRFVNSNLSLDLNKKLTTLNFGGSVAFDVVEPSLSGWNSYSSPTHHFVSHKTTQQYLLGVSQVIDKDSLLQSNMTFGYHHGFMNDPYKWVMFYNDNNFSDFQQDKRPQERFEWAWLNQYVRHFGQFNDAALHLDYRFATNDWGINSHTLEVSWHQPIVDDWQIIPRFRYYSQDSADFYQPVFSGKSTDYSAYSSDYRLAGFGAFSGGLKLSKEITEIKPLSSLKFQTGFEYYNHKARYELGGNNGGSFDSFSYWLMTASVNLKF